MAAPVVAVTGMAFEARIAQGPGVDAVYAARADLLRTALAQALARGASGVISFGTAGGLAEGLPAGTFIVADAIDGPFGQVATDSAWTARVVALLNESAPGTRLQLRRGVLAAVAAAVTSVDEKRALNRANGALAVDMESHIAAAMAREQGLPFVACRAVVDPVWRALPPAATAGLRDDGTTALLPILSSLARAPGQLGPMLRLACDARAARGALIEARRALGTAFGLN